jgi:MSHA biogenesis protein MshG
MGLYKYRARSQKGDLVTGEIEAREVAEARRLISQRKLIPIELKPAPTSASDDAAISGGGDAGGAPASGWKFPSLAKLGLSFGPRLSNADLMMFFQQMQTIYAVGVPLIRGLRLMQEQTESVELRKCLEIIIKEVSEGQPLSAALAKFPTHFDAITVNLIRAGEASGQLDEILDQVSAFLQQRLEQTSKVKAAMFYPKIVVGMMGVVFALVVGFVIPKFEGVFSRFGGELPAITRFMLGLSNVFVGYWYLILIMGGLGVHGFRAYVATPQGRRRWDAFMLKVPYFGGLFLQSDVLNFCSVLELLIRSGIPITQGLKILQGAVRNTLFVEDVGRLHDLVEQGNTIRTGLESSQIFPRPAASLIGIGEETGELERALNRLARFYKMQIDDKLNNLSKAIEPILLIFIFGMVLALALAVFLPMWKMGSLTKK